MNKKTKRDMKEAYLSLMWTNINYLNANEIWVIRNSHAARWESSQNIHIDNRAKELKALWDNQLKSWLFPSTKALDTFLAAAVDETGCKIKSFTHYSHIEKELISRLKVDFISLGHGYVRVEVDFNREFAVDTLNIVRAYKDVLKFRLVYDDDKDIPITKVYAIVTKENAARLQDYLKDKVTICNVNASNETTPPIKVTVDGWDMIFDFRDHPMAALFKPKVNYQEEQAGYGWDYTLTVTRAEARRLIRSLSEEGIDVTGQLPPTDDTDMFAPVPLVKENIPGWNGDDLVLRDYQKAGVEFIVSRGLRCILADEMGIGKTAQAISAAVGAGLKKIVIVCPGSARYVWVDEIKKWGNQGDVVCHLKKATDKINPDARWVIASYDLLIARKENFSTTDERIAKKIKQYYSKLAKVSRKGNRWQATFSRPFKISKQLANLLTIAQMETLERISYRLGEPIQRAIIDYAPELLILDEAHKIKNSESKRTAAIKNISNTKYLLFVTGTPVLNHYKEAEPILALLNDEVDQYITYEEVSDILCSYIIRRHKCDVIKELPQKIRQQIYIEPSGPKTMKRYYEIIDQIIEGARHRGHLFGLLESARRALGIAKVDDGQITDLIENIVIEKSKVIVFAHHHDVLDILQRQLKSKNIGVVKVDGRMTNTSARAEAAARFQEDASINVFLGGIKSAGESITLTKADTVVFVELDWVPATLLQAEDRGHRVGQKANSYHIITVVAQVPESLDERILEVILPRKTQHVAELLKDEVFESFSEADVKIKILKNIRKEK